VGLKEAEVVGTAMLTLTVATTLVGILTYLVGGCRDTPRHTRPAPVVLTAAAVCMCGPRQDAAVLSVQQNVFHYYRKGDNMIPYRSAT